MEIHEYVHMISYDHNNGNNDNNNDNNNNDNDNDNMPYILKQQHGPQNYCKKVGSFIQELDGICFVLRNDHLQSSVV